MYSSCLPACLPCVLVLVLVRSTESGPFMSCTHKPEREVKNKTQSKASREEEKRSEQNPKCLSWAFFDCFFSSIHHVLGIGFASPRRQVGSQI